MNNTVSRRPLAEFTGTGLLVAIVIGSGIAATGPTSDAALRLLINSLITAMGLAVLILVFMPAGGAKFNPIVTGADGYSPVAPNTGTAWARPQRSSSARSLAPSPAQHWPTPCSARRC